MNSDHIYIQYYLVQYVITTLWNSSTFSKPVLVNQYSLFVIWLSVTKTTLEADKTLNNTKTYGMRFSPYANENLLPIFLIAFLL